MTPEELTAAMTEAQVEIIDEAVAEGRLTEEQAAKLKERIEEYGPLSVIGLRHRGTGRALPRRAAGGRGGGGGPRQGAGGGRGGGEVGREPGGAGEAQGMSVEDFKAALLDAIKRMLQAKVDEGTITQEQADRIFAGIEEHIDRIVNFEGQGGDGPCERPAGRSAATGRGDASGRALRRHGRGTTE